MRWKPDYAEAHYNLATALAGRGELDGAIKHLQAALVINPGFAEARQSLDVALSRREAILKAVADRLERIGACPTDIALLNDTAWMLAVNRNASVRNGAEAVKLAQRAAELSGGRQPQILDTLAAAYAESGRSSAALETAQRARDSPSRKATPRWRRNPGEN